MNQTQRILDALDHEWDQLTAGPSTRRHLRRWQEREPSLRGARSLVELRSQIESSSLEESSEMVWALLAIAAQEHLADRLLLQVIVPGLAGEARWLMSWARRVEPDLIGNGDIDQMLALAGIEAIRHAHGHRRAYPICSILRRTHRLLTKETREIEAWHSKTVLDEIEPAPTVTSDPAARPGQMLLDLLSEATEAGAVSRSDADLIWMIDVAGFSSAELAPSLGIAPRSVAQRRLRAEGRLSKMVGEAA